MARAAGAGQMAADGGQMAADGGRQLPDAVVGPYLDIYFTEIHHWEARHAAAFAFLVLFGTEFVAKVVWHVFGAFPRLFPKLHLNPRLHHDTLDRRDILYIVVNKGLTVCFTYHAFRFLTLTSTVKWKAEEATFVNCVFVLVPMYLAFDLFFSAFHRLLHLKQIYPYIHKHHHKQVSPTRGSHDAFNVHPFEFAIGEYIHLVAFYMIPCHIFAVLVFMVLGASAATLNHMRLSVCIPGVYDSKDHATHHRAFDCNYGQYTMFWDKLWGWYRPFEEKLSK